MFINIDTIHNDDILYQITVFNLGTIHNCQHYCIETIHFLRLPLFSKRFGQTFWGSKQGTMLHSSAVPVLHKKLNFL